MKIVEFSLERRVTVAMVAIAVSLFGAVAFTRLPVNLLPDISYPSLTVEARYPGAAPAEIEALVTRPVEEAVGVVAGVERMSSVSRPGLSQVTLEFAWGRNMDFAALDVRQKLDLVTLPEETTKPILLRFDPANDPVVRLYVTGSDDLYQLRYLGKEVLKKDLESAEGLAAVKVNGGYEEEIHVRIDEGKLSLLGLSIQEVRDRLRRENINQAGGSLYEQEARYLVRARNEFQDLGDILDTVVLHRDGRLVTLADVATVDRGHKQREVITRFDGREAVELALYKEGDANTVAVAEAVAERLERIAEELPEGIEVITGVDQSRFIQGSIREVLSNAALGGVIAVLVLLLFLKDARSTLVIGISIPLSIVTTFFLMYQTGTSLNIMSLGGLALGVGMLVDNAIVVLEAIYKHREKGAGALEAARRGASEVGTAVIASTLTTVAVFLPVVFLQGIAAQLFRDQALTVSFSLIASLAVALTLIPMLAALLARDTAPTGRWPVFPRFPRWPFVERWPRLLRWVALPFTLAIGTVFYALYVLLVGLFWLLRTVTRLLVAAVTFVGRPVGRVFDRGMDGLLALYPRVLGGALRARGLVVGIAVAALAGAVLLVPGLGLDLIPVLSQGEFSFRVELPEGTPLPSTDRLLADVGEVLDDDPRVESWSVIAGGAGLTMASTGTEGENVGRIQVRMADGATPADEDAVAAGLRARLAAVEEARFKFERPSVFTLRTPIEVELYGDDVAALHTSAQSLRDTLATVPGLVDVKTSAELGNPELQITFNRDHLVRLGLDLAQVAETVRNKVQGDVATRFTEGDREIDIVVRSVVPGEASAGDVADLIIGQHVPGRGTQLAASPGSNPRRPDGGDVDQMNRLDRFNMVGAQGAAAGGPTIPLRLKSVAEVELAKGPSEIRRIAQKRAAVVSGNLAGRDMGAVAADVETVLRREAATMPAGVVGKLSGQHEEMQASFRSLLLAMALAIFLVYLVMASQFESFLHPFVIIFTLPLGAIGVVAALAVTGTTINVVALIGAVMLAGIVVNNAIVLIDAVNRLRREEGLPKHEALVAAGQQRLRPILMTSATTIFGLLPMALGLGEGAELRAPLAITVIGGLAVATGLTLVVIPVVYSLLDRERLPADVADRVPTSAVPTGAVPTDGSDYETAVLADPAMPDAGAAPAR